MKLPSHISKRKKFTVYIVSYYILVLVMFAPVQQLYAASATNNFSQINNEEFLDELRTEIISVGPAIKQTIRPEEVGSPYAAITSDSGSGDNFDVNDYLIYNDSHSLNVQYNLNYPDNPDYVGDSYTVSDQGYTDDYLEYDITSMQAITDYYALEANVDQSQYVQLRDDQVVVYAQGFEVKWDYANFTKAKIYLWGFPGVSADRVELTLVSDDGTGKPNQTDILASMGPYEPRFLPVSAYPDMPVFDFADQVLTKGKYYIIANLTASGGPTAPHAWWYYNGTHNDGLAFRSFTNGPSLSWAAFNYNLALSVELLPVNSTYHALEFSSPDQIDLTDNSTSITNSNSIISGTFTGYHLLEANTSVDIVFTTNYAYQTTHTGTSVYSITNSTFDQMAIDWDITWSTAEASTTYTLVDRNMTVSIPLDWSGTYNWYYETVTDFTFTKLTDYYIIYLGDNSSAANWWIETTSPNHLYSATFSDGVTETERFYLGYWTTDTFTAEGFNGSSVYLEADVKFDVGVLTNDTTGTLNYTLYDPDGNIVALKSVGGNLSYSDSTEYSLGSITNTAGGYFEEVITFDPSVYGTDKAGFWTAAVTWKNGTEVGFYSQRIVVQTQTTDDLEWEVTPGSGTWTTADITRKGLDSFTIQGYYHNVSEPFFDDGKSIPDAQLSYVVSNATWNKNGNFDDYAPLYNASVLVDFDVGVYTVDITLSGAFLEEQTVSFDITVFYELALNPQFTSTQTNYTNNGIYLLTLRDETNAVDLITSPDDMTVEIFNATDNYLLSSPADYSFTYGVSEWSLDISTSTNSLVVGVYSVGVSFSYNDYRANYSDTYESDVFSLEIVAPKTIIQAVGNPTTIYAEHSRTLSFDFHDTNHSLDLTGADVTVSSNYSLAEVGLVVNPVGSSYEVIVTNNLVTSGGIEINVSVTLDNYESILDYTLGDLEVLIANTNLVEVIIYTPTESYVGYNTSVVVEYNDITHFELINDASIISVIVNSSSYTSATLDYLGGGLYNITFVNNDVNLAGLNITITLGKPGFADATVSIQISVVSISTDSRLADITDQDIVVNYQEQIDIEVIYWDDISMVNISVPDIQVAGNITVSFNFNSVDNITSVTIYSIDQLGYFYLNITMLEPGYAPQMIQIYLTVIERPTNVEVTPGQTIQEYASETTDVYFDFRDFLDGNDSIISASTIAVFAAANSSLNINTYFESITYSTFTDLYVVSFTPTTSLAVGATYVIEITISRYGYESQVIIIRLEFYPAVDYDIDVSIDGELQQLDTFQFIVTVGNASQDLMALSADELKLAPNPNGDVVQVTYTFYFANGTNITHIIYVDLAGSGGTYTGLSEEILIPWRATGISYYVTYTPVGDNQDVLLSKSSVEGEPVETASPNFLALLTFLFREYTYYMVAGLAVLAVIFIVLTIYLGVIRPKKQKKSASKRGYLDKISKILTSVLALRKVIIVHNETGLPVYEWDLGGDMTVDSSLVTGFLQAVAGMGSEISGGQTGAVRKLDYGQFVVSSASKDCICAYLFSTTEVSVDVETGLAEFVEWFEKRFQPILHDWNGITDEFQNNSRAIMDTLSEELFIWTLYPLSINQAKEKEVAKLSATSQKIFKFIKDYKEVTISVALEYFNKTPIEETLTAIFNLVDDKFILRMRLR